MDIIGASGFAISLWLGLDKDLGKIVRDVGTKDFPRAFDEFLRFAIQPLTIPTDAVSLFSFHGGGVAGPSYDQEAQASEASSTPSAVQPSRAHKIASCSFLSMSQNLKAA